jgi:hypothetical protein
MTPTIRHPRPNFYESDDGYSVEILGRLGMEYREGDRVLLVESEIGMADVPTIAIWKDEIRGWKEPYNQEPITEQKRIEILKNICAVLKWDNIQVEIHSDAGGWVKGWIE